MDGIEPVDIGPHGAQRVELLEDAPNPDNRIYVIKEDGEEKLSILGSELEDLSNWWSEERERESGSSMD